MRQFHFVIASFLVLPSLCSAQESSNDFFPLAVGNHWIYDYSLSDLESNSITMDTGTATYTILSRIASTDSSIWSVMEIREAVRTRGLLGGPYGTPTFVHDSTIFHLIEYDHGNHRIKASGYTGAWPGNEYKSAFLFYSQFSDSTVFFRYILGDNQDTVTVNTGYSDFQGLTVLFQRNHGPADISFWWGAPHFSFRTHYTLKEVSTSSFVEPEDYLPDAFSLEQNYPNPFNPSTTISFNLLSKMYVSLKVYDVLGREITVLISEELRAGTYLKQWNAKGLLSGVYFYRLQVGSFTETKKLVLLR